MSRRRKKNFLKGFIPVLLAGILIIGIGSCFLLWNRKESRKDAGTQEEKSAAATSQIPNTGNEAEEEPESELEPELVTEPERTEEEIREEQVEEILMGMTLEEKVLQLFMITPEALTGYSTVTAAGDATKDSIMEYPVGGLIYFAKNLKSPDQVQGMLENTCTYYKDAGYPLPLLAVDEEGGQVARIGSQSAFGVEKFRDMSAVGKDGDPEEARRIGTVIGSYLSELGFNLDFAPVADVLTNPNNQVVARRSFGSDAELVKDMVLSEVQGMESEGVLATLKHYPGHGSTLSDTHAGYAYTDKTLEELMQEELVPFTAAIQEGIHFIMVAHISVPAVTGDSTPCSLSRYMITDVLRGELGYDGIVVTDALNMGAISQQYSSAEAAVEALKAGVDLILMPADFQSAYEGVLLAVRSGELTEEEIEESVRRILRVKI